MEKQHSEAVTDLRTAQAQLGLLASNKNTEVERAQHSQNIESLQSRIRELERKMELQNVRHDELLLELAALRRNHAGNSGGGASSHHGSSQSLGASFDLDSRGSTPGITSFDFVLCCAALQMALERLNDLFIFSLRVAYRNFRITSLRSEWRYRWIHVLAQQRHATGPERFESARRPH